MSKLIKKYEEFLNENAPAQTETEEETIVKPAPGRRQKGLDQPSVSPDPLALADLKDGKINSYVYNDVYEIEYPSETNSYTVNNVILSDDPQSVIDYINKKEGDKKLYYDAEYEKPELSGVKVGPEGELDGFKFDEDPEYQARVGKNTLKESKSYKNSRKFNKRK